MSLMGSYSYIDCRFCVRAYKQTHVRNNFSLSSPQPHWSLALSLVVSPSEHAN